MKVPLRSVLDRCKVGFPLWQKVLFTGGALFYTVLPLDVLPDVLPPFTYADDIFVLYVMVRVWRSPTLRAAVGIPTPAAAVSPATPPSHPPARMLVEHVELVRSGERGAP